MIKVSVIVPIYNAEKYIRECIDSILAQTLKDFELICVDDGSTDSTPTILAAYCQADSRVKLLRQKNSYAGVARNTGMKEASGEYMVFWDADDHFEPNALEELYKKAKQTHADVCVCGANHFHDNSNVKGPSPSHLRMNLVPQDSECFNIHSNEENILMFTTVSPWNKIYSRSFVEENDLQFSASKTSNDVFFVVSSLCLANRITTVNLPLINYRTSQTNSLVVHMKDDPLCGVINWMDAATFLKERNSFPAKSFANRCFNSMLMIMQNIPEFNAYSKMYLYLQEEAYSLLALKPIEENYYPSQWKQEAALLLETARPEQFLSHLLAYTFERSRVSGTKNNQLKLKNSQLKSKNSRLKQKNSQLKLKNNQLKNRIQILKEKNNVLTKKASKLEHERDEIKNSTSYKLGQKILFLPGKIKNHDKKK